MKLPSTVAEAAGSSPMRRYGLPVTEGAGIPHPDAEGITEEVIHDVVVEFYRRARRDERLGPVFEAHIARMGDPPCPDDRLLVRGAVAVRAVFRQAGRATPSDRPPQCGSFRPMDRIVRIDRA